MAAALSVALKSNVVKATGHCSAPSAASMFVFTHSTVAAFRAAAFPPCVARNACISALVTENVRPSEATMLMLWLVTSALLIFGM